MLVGGWMLEMARPQEQNQQYSNTAQLGMLIHDGKKEKK